MNVARTNASLLIELDSEQETERLGRALADACEPGCVIGLTGPLGARQDPARPGHRRVSGSRSGRDCQSDFCPDP